MSEYPLRDVTKLRKRLDEELGRTCLANKLTIILDDFICPNFIHTHRHRSYIVDSSVETAACEDGPSCRGNPLSGSRK